MTVHRELQEYFRLFGSAVKGELKDPLDLLNQWEAFLVAWRKESPAMSKEDQEEVLGILSIFKDALDSSADRVGKKMGLSGDEFIKSMASSAEVDPAIAARIEEKKESILQRSRELSKLKKIQERGAQRSSTPGKKGGKRARGPRSKWLKT